MDDYKRGKFAIDESWSKDKTVCYYQGAKMKVYWPLAKTVGLIVLYNFLRSETIGASLPVTLSILLLLIVYS